MLSKVSRENNLYGTYAIQQCKLPYDIIQDNQHNYMLICSKSKIYLWNCKLNKKYNCNIIKLYYKNIFYFKQIYSFDQNNIKHKKEIRDKVIEFYNDNNKKSDNIIGIGGEYYVYFLLFNYKKYIGISNHKTIIEDAQYNMNYHHKLCHNKYVDYNNLKMYPSINNTYDVILNVITITNNIIEYLKNANTIIIITCKPIHDKISKFTNHVIKKLYHVVYDKSVITICYFIRK